MVTSKDETLPLVSVIIACKNSATHFARCLMSVRDQSYGRTEIIVVDNYSTDGTFEIGQEYADLALRAGPERSTQFNVGFAHASGELIYRIGPDYVLDQDVIEKCVGSISSGFDAVAVHNRSIGESIWARVRYLERESYRNDQSIVAVRFMKSEVFAALGGFDTTLVAGEDFDLHNRLVAAGYSWCHVDAVENHVGEPLTLADVWRKFYYYGRTIRRYQRKNPRIARQQLRFFRPSFRATRPRLFSNPKLVIAFYVYLVVKHAAGLAGAIRGAPTELDREPAPLPARAGDGLDPETTHGFPV